MCFPLFGCKSTDYKKAILAAQNGRYLEAIDIFNDLSDYKDSATQFEVVIDEYANYMIRYHAYDEAINLYICYSSSLDMASKLPPILDEYSKYLIEQGDFDAAISLYTNHSDIADYSEKISELASEKELYSTYSEAIDFFNRRYFTSGFQKLSTLPEDYRNTKIIKQSYEDLKDTPFRGIHKYGNRRTSQSLHFSINFSTLFERFQLCVHKEIYFSDGSIFKTYDFSFDPAEITGDTISAYSNRNGEKRRFNWTVNSDGSITEIENNTVFVYD